MYESPDTPQPLFDLAVGLAKALAPVNVRSLEMGPFPLPLTDKQRNACSAFWATARVNAIPVVRIKDDTTNTVRYIAYPEGR